MTEKEEYKKDCWDKLKIIAYVFGMVLIGVGAYIGNRYTNAIKEKEIQGGYIEIAVSILREQPTKENYNIRNWAIETINLYSEVKLNDSVQEDLKTNTTFPQKPEPVIIANKSMPKGDLLVELLKNGCLQKLCSAKDILRSGAMNAEIEAADIYREVLNKLSYESFLQLDQELIAEADSDYQKQFYKEAATKYKVLFNPYYKYCDK